MSSKYNLREGFTTGSAATAAILAGLNALYKKFSASFMKISAPCGFLSIPIYQYLFSDRYSKAVVVKDGGDDPDCTHNLKIISEVYLDNIFFDGDNLHKLNLSPLFDFYTGEGIGIVTLDGLPVKVGEPAINPIPRKMIKENVESFLKALNINKKPTIILSIPEGKDVAKKTLNERLGIIGGISILGTTGIVKPISMDAFTQSIDLALKVAKKRDKDNVVLSFGRQSEESAMKMINLSKESFVMMGDHFHYAVNRAKRMGFKNITISCQFGKILKALLGYKNTNVKYGEFNVNEVIDFFRGLNIPEKELEILKKANTGRHLLEIIEKEGIKYILDIVTLEFSKKYKVKVLLFSYDGRLISKA